MQKRSMLEMTTHEFAEAAPKRCFWAVGTIEAHDLGPLGTDVIAPEKLCIDLAPEFDAAIMPTLPYGLVASLAGYPGSVWLSAPTYRAMIFELGASLARSGVESLVVFNGHGGNTAALAEVLPRLWKEASIRAAAVDWWTVCGDLSEEFFGSAGGHGGADELALVRAARPDLAPASWDGSRAFFSRPGVACCPSPRSAIRYTEAPARPMTPESARGYFDAVVERMRGLVAEILAGWAG